MDASQATGSSTAVRNVPAPQASATLATSSFESSVPFTGAWGNTLVIYCVDPRFRRQTHEFLHGHLNVEDPAVLTVPGGVAVLLPLVGVAHKFVKSWVDLLFSKHRPQRIIIVAHQDCAAYGAVKHPVLSFALKAATGRTVGDLQNDHLRQARFTLTTWFPGVPVDAYFASVKDGADGSHRVVFAKVE